MLRKGEIMIQYIEYPKCSTCVKGKKYLQEKGVEFSQRNIVEEVPTIEELKSFMEKSGLPIKRFFNTSGMKYRELNMKEKFPVLSEEELLQLLASDGMLIKRPLLVGEDFVIPGFKEKEYEEKLKK